MLPEDRSVDVPPPATSPTIPPSPAFHVLDAFAQGLRPTLRHPAAILGATLLSVTGLILVLAASLIPHAAWITLPLLLLTAGPVWGPLSLLALKSWRGQKPRVRDLFLEARSSFRPLATTVAFLILLTGFALVPGATLIVLGFQAGNHAQDLTPASATLLATGLLLGPALALIPAALYGFAPALVLDHHLPAAAALQLSRRTTLRQPFRNLLLAAACATLATSGLLLAGFGLCFTLPWILGARAHVHDRLFAHPHAMAA
jgi:hypothetical protein